MHVSQHHEWGFLQNRSVQPYPTSHNILVYSGALVFKPVHVIIGYSSWPAENFFPVSIVTILVITLS